MPRTILDVGQCMVDGPRLDALLRDKLGCTVTRADSIADALAQLQSNDFNLCLINREFAFEHSHGLDLIASAKDAGVKTPLMLVSDKPEAQKKAEALGALPGFGKAHLYDPQTLEVLKNAIGE